jgi:hypothetical protein
MERGGARHRCRAALPAFGRPGGGAWRAAAGTAGASDKENIVRFGEERKAGGTASETGWHEGKEEWAEIGPAWLSAFGAPSESSFRRSGTSLTRVRETDVRKAFFGEGRIWRVFVPGASVVGDVRDDLEKAIAWANRALWEAFAGHQKVELQKRGIHGP